MNETTVEIITVGREILDGRVLDTNSVFLALQLKSLGLTARHAQRVDDETSRVVEAFHLAQKRSKLILVTGGLGPTSDDLTAQAAADFLGEKTALNTEALQQIEERFKQIQRPMLDIQSKQALLPVSSFVLKNSAGTAPGFGFKKDSALWFFMPGVPKEMKAMFMEQILPRIPKEMQQPSFSSITWATHFTSEGELQERLRTIESENVLPFGFELSYRTRLPENHIGLYGSANTPQLAEAFTKAEQKIDTTLGKDVFSKAKYPFESEELESVVVKLLRENQVILATVESCTGGLVANRITNVSGSSEAFWGGIVCYDNHVKESVIGVSPETLKQFGAVSTETAKELCEGWLQKMKVPGGKKKICIATTGIAGPTGGTAQKPVGTCYVGIASDFFETRVEKVPLRHGWGRAENKLYFAQRALELVRGCFLD